jgi:hypothetical protein
VRLVYSVYSNNNNNNNSDSKLNWLFYHCVQPCVTYSHNKSYNDLLLFVYLSMLLQRFYSLILPNPGVQVAYNKYMSIYSG